MDAVDAREAVECGGPFWDGGAGGVERGGAVPFDLDGVDVRAQVVARGAEEGLDEARERRAVVVRCDSETGRLV